MTATDPRTGQTVDDTQVRFAGSGPSIPGGQRAGATQSRTAAGDPNSRSSQTFFDDHTKNVGVAHPPIGSAEPSGSPSGGVDAGDCQKLDDAQLERAVTDGQDRAHGVFDAHHANGPVLADPLLALAADVLDDLERVRIANENRLRQLTRDVTDSDGLERGFGLTLDHPDVKRLAALVEALAKSEHDAELNLKRQLRAHPLGPWVKQARGVGEKQAARLLAAIGDPFWNDLYARPRTVSELWAYAGYHVIRPETGGGPDQPISDTHLALGGVAATRARGQRANWSATAKMRAYLVATSIVKAGGEYREVYDEGRAKYADAVHEVACRRCGPSGRPALPGSALSDGHKHARALRLVSKAVLKDLWREAKCLHELHDGQTNHATQGVFAVVDPTSGDHMACDPHASPVAGSTSGGAS